MKFRRCRWIEDSLHVPAVMYISMATRLTVSHDSKVTKRCLRDTTSSSSIIRTSHLFRLQLFTLIYIPISVLSFNRDENIFVDVKHLKHVQLPSSNRVANIPSRSVDCSSFVFYCLPFQPTSSSSTFRWQTVRPLVNVTFWPNNSRDSRISLQRMDCISFSNFRSRHPFDGCWKSPFYPNEL